MTGSAGVRPSTVPVVARAAGRRLGRGHKLGYGLGCIGYSLPHQIIASSFLLFATAVLRVPALWAGAIIGVSAAWDAVSDPLMGFISDNTDSPRFGRRHGYMLVGGGAVALLTVAFWSIPPTFSPPATAALLLLLLLAIKTALTVFVAPYNALGGELSQDYDERSSVQSYRAAFYLVGMIVALAGSNLLFFRSTPSFPQGQLDPAAYPRMGAAFGAIVLVATLLTFAVTARFIPTLPRRSPAMRGRGTAAAIVDDLRGALGNRDFLALTSMIFFIEVGFQIGIAMGFHVNTYTYRLPGPIIGIHGLVILGSSILSQPFWLWVSRRHDKRTALWLGMASALVGFVGAPLTHVAFPVFPIAAPSLPFTLGAFFLLGGIGNGAFMSIPYSMVADTVDVEELASGKRDEGVYFGIYTFAYKLGTSLSLVASGVVLHLVGFRPDAVLQSASTLHRLAMVPAYLLLLFSPLVVLSLARYTITRERHAAVRAALDRRRS